jgi:hypothetical protein
MNTIGMQFLDLTVPCSQIKIYCRSKLLNPTELWDNTLYPTIGKSAPIWLNKAKIEKLQNLWCALKCCFYEHVQSKRFHSTAVLQCRTISQYLIVEHRKISTFQLSKTRLLCCSCLI